MIVGVVTFFSDTCVKSAGRPCTPPDTDKRIPPCGIPVGSHVGSLVVLKSASKDLIDATLKTFGWSIDKMLINVINEIRYKNHNT